MVGKKPLPLGEASHRIIRTLKQPYVVKNEVSFQPTPTPPPCKRAIFEMDLPAPVKPTDFSRPGEHFGSYFQRDPESEPLS